MKAGWGRPTIRRGSAGAICLTVRFHPAVMENMVKRAILIALCSGRVRFRFPRPGNTLRRHRLEGRCWCPLTVNPNTAAFSAIAPILVGGNSIGMTGLAFNPLNNVLYGVTGLESPNFKRNLVSINPATGAATVIGAILDPDFGSSLGLTDLSFRSDGTLFGISPNNMYTINLSERCSHGDWRDRRKSTWRRSCFQPFRHPFLGWIGHGDAGHIEYLDGSAHSRPDLDQLSSCRIARSDDSARLQQCGHAFRLRQRPCAKWRDDGIGCSGHDQHCDRCRDQRWRVTERHRRDCIWSGGARAFFSRPALRSAPGYSVTCAAAGRTDPKSRRVSLPPLQRRGCHWRAASPTGCAFPPPNDLMNSGDRWKQCPGDGN